MSGQPTRRGAGRSEDNVTDHRGGVDFKMDEHGDRNNESLRPTTTAQQDITTASQRKVNLIWEYTQAAIAVMVVAANIVVWVAVTLKGSANPIPPGLGEALFLVIGFYFSRTNHQAIGGIGPKPQQPYEGR